MKLIKLFVKMLLPVCLLGALQGCAEPSPEAVAGPEELNTTPLVLNDEPVGGGFPHKADYLFPPVINSETRAIVAIHGGGGEKHAFAYSLGIKNVNEPGYGDAASYNQQYLIDNNVVLIFVQGLSIPEKPDSFTWSNHIMTSGHDDKAMLEFLAAQLRTRFSKVYLMGHSMGGSMTNRMWCESPLTFDAYGSSAGPMSATNAANCNPQVKQPYVHVAALNDGIIQLVGHETETFLDLDGPTRIAGGKSFVDRDFQFKNELVSYPWRGQQICGTAPTSTAAFSPSLSNWMTKTRTDCDGNLRLIEVRHADHCISKEVGNDGYKCTQPLNTLGTTEHMDRFVSFFRGH